MADKEAQSSVRAIAAEVEEQGLRWHPAETSLAALPVAERKRYLGLKVTQAQMRKMEEEVALQAADERAAFAVGEEFAAPAALMFS